MHTFKRMLRKHEDVSKEMNEDRKDEKGKTEKSGRERKERKKGVVDWHSGTKESQIKEKGGKDVGEFTDDENWKQKDAREGSWWESKRNVSQGQLDDH